MGLADLSHFVVDGLEYVAGDSEMRVSGHFTHLRGVKDNRGWLYRGQELPVIGDLERVPTENNEAVVFVTPDVDLSAGLERGQVYPWLDGNWQSYHLDIVLSPETSWRRQRFFSEPAQYFVLNGVTGWQPMDQPLPEGAVPTRVQEGAWDHEHCEFCMRRIGTDGDPEGYVTRGDHWLCVECYDRYAARHDVSFALEP